MATHEYVWVRGGGQLFLTTKRNNYQKYIQDRVEISDTQFDVRIRIVNSRTILEHMSRSFLPRVLAMILEEILLKDASCRWRWNHNCELT
jgi:hypothetical protein